MLRALNLMVRVFANRLETRIISISTFYLLRPTVPQRLNSFLTGNSELRELAQKAGKLAALDRLYRQAIPPALAKASRVIGFEQHVLTVGADNNAIAAKLRHLTPHVLKKVQESNTKVTGILIKVQVSQPTPTHAKNVPILSEEGHRQLGDLAATLDNSPLKRALLRLIKR